MPDNDKNIIPACGILGLYSEGYFRFEVTAPGLLGYGGVFFKHIYLTAGGGQEEGSKNQEVRTISKEPLFQAKYFYKDRNETNYGLLFRPPVPG